MAIALNKKSGKGRVHGVASELTAFFTIKPGHADDLRAALERFQARAQPRDATVFERLGLRTQRHVIFDNGRRVMWCTAFESDWDPYIEDAIQIFGQQSWVDWLQHTEEYTGGFESSTSAEVKAFLQSGQEPAVTFFDALSNYTLPQVKKALQLANAFQQVLDDAEAAQVLQHPALKPLLDQAAD
jgi:hypothetical protein